MRSPYKRTLAAIISLKAREPRNQSDLRGHFAALSCSLALAAGASLRRVLRVAVTIIADISLAGTDYCCSLTAPF
jgi:hypothetical protein